MNARFVKFACLLGALSMWTLAASAETPIAKASVPFEFAAGGAMLPPGEYTLDMPDSGVLILHGPAGNSVALLTIASDTGSASSNAKLLFERHDGMAFLSAVEWPGQGVKVPFTHVVKTSATASLH